MCIEFSVGRNGANEVDDVKAVQILLNMNLYRLTPFRAVPETGSMDATTLGAIDAFFKDRCRTIMPFAACRFAYSAGPMATSNRTAMHCPISAMARRLVLPKPASS